MNLLDHYLVSAHQQQLLTAARIRRLERSAEIRHRRPRRQRRPEDLLRCPGSPEVEAVCRRQRSDSAATAGSSSVPDAAPPVPDRLGSRFPCR